MVGTAPFEAPHAEGVAALCAELGWTTYADPGVAVRGMLAPGVVTRVALDGDRVVGFAQACGDGLVQSFLAQLAVSAAYRHRGIARRLVEEVLAATGTQRMDLLTDHAQDFYASFAHRRKDGFRIYPGLPG